MRRRGRERASEGEGRDRHPQCQPTGAAGTIARPYPDTPGEGTRGQYPRRPAPGGAGGCPGSTAPRTVRAPGNRRARGEEGKHRRGKSSFRGCKQAASPLGEGDGETLPAHPPSHPTLNLPFTGGMGGGKLYIKSQTTLSSYPSPRPSAPIHPTPAGRGLWGNKPGWGGCGGGRGGGMRGETRKPSRSPSPGPTAGPAPPSPSVLPPPRRRGDPAPLGRGGHSLPPCPAGPVPSRGPRRDGSSSIPPPAMNM